MVQQKKMCIFWSTTLRKPTFLLKTGCHGELPNDFVWQCALKLFLCTEVLCSKQRSTTSTLTQWRHKRCTTWRFPSALVHLSSLDWPHQKFRSMLKSRGKWLDLTFQRNFLSRCLQIPSHCRASCPPYIYPFFFPSAAGSRNVTRPPKASHLFCVPVAGWFWFSASRQLSDDSQVVQLCACLAAN